MVVCEIEWFIFSAKNVQWIWPELQNIGRKNHNFLISRVFDSSLLLLLLPGLFSASQINGRTSTFGSRDLSIEWERHSPPDADRATDPRHWLLFTASVARERQVSFAFDSRLVFRFLFPCFRNDWQKLMRWIRLNKYCWSLFYVISTVNPRLSGLDSRPERMLDKRGLTVIQSMIYNSAESIYDPYLVPFSKTKIFTLSLENQNFK